MKNAALWLGLAVATVVAGEATGKRIEIYAGALGGAVLGLVGILFGARIARKHQEAKARKDGRWDIWALWGSGMLLRLALLGIFGLACWKFFGPNVQPAMLSLAVVYLVLLFWEAGMLYRILIDKDPPTGTKDG